MDLKGVTVSVDPGGEVVAAQTTGGGALLHLAL